jgi:hypothetical protein
VLRPRKEPLAISLGLDDCYWAKVRGFEFSRPQGLESICHPED